MLLGALYPTVGFPPYCTYIRTHFPSSGTTRTCFVSYRTIRMFHTPSQYAKPEVECTLL